MNGPCEASWRNPRVLSILALVFLAGATAGAVGMRLGIHQSLHKNGPYWKEGGKEISLQRFKKELSLTPQQEKDMEGVLDDFMMYYQTLQAQMEEVRSAGKSRILRILNEGQKQRFERMLNDMQARR